MLYQYDEEIEGAKKESFTLEGKGEFNPEENKARELAKVSKQEYILCISIIPPPPLRDSFFPPPTSLGPMFL